MKWKQQAWKETKKEKEMDKLNAICLMKGEDWKHKGKKNQKEPRENKKEKEKGINEILKIRKERKKYWKEK